MKWANYDLSSGCSICAAGFDKCWLLRLRQPYIIHLISAPEGNSEFCFPRVSMFSETKSWETFRVGKTKLAIPKGSRHKCFVI